MIHSFQKPNNLLRPCSNREASRHQPSCFNYYHFFSSILISVGNGFTGIYSISFPQRCWDTAGEKVYFSSSQKALVQIVCVDTVKREAEYITAGLEEKGTYSLLDIVDGLMLFSYNCPSQPSVVVSAVKYSRKLQCSNGKCVFVCEWNY